MPSYARIAPGVSRRPRAAAPSTPDPLSDSSGSGPRLSAMETGKTTSDLSDVALAGVVSLLVNLGWIFIAPADQRVIVVGLFSVVLGLVMLAGEETGAYGFGIIVGAMLAGFVGLALVGMGMSPLPS